MRVSNPPSFAFKTVDQLIRKWCKVTGCERFVLVMQDRTVPNFRYAIAKTKPYKANRKDSNRPLLETDIRNYISTAYKSHVEWVAGIEVDDGLGIMQDKVGGTTCIASNDKDLDMIPGFRYDPDVGSARRTKYGTVTKLKTYKTKGIYYVTDPGFVSLREKNGKKYLTGAGKMWFLAQMLTGDRTDNIPGIPKYGDVSTYNALVDCKTADEGLRKVISIYRERLTDFTREQVTDRIMEAAQLLWVKRKPNEIIIPKKYLDNP